MIHYTTDTGIRSCFEVQCVEQELNKAVTLGFSHKVVTHRQIPKLPRRPPQDRLSEASGYESYGMATFMLKDESELF